MSLEISWQLVPRHTEHSLDAQAWDDQPGEWIQLAQAVEYAGIDRLWVPGDSIPAESLGVTAALCAHTRSLGFTVSITPEVILPAALAATAQSLQSISGNRVRLHLPDGEKKQLRSAFGEWLNRDQRSERIGEYLDILQHLLNPASDPLNFAGRYFQLENAGIARRTLPAPALILDDSQSITLLARHADECVLRSAEPRWVISEIARLQAAANEQGRTIKFACDLGLIMASSEALAWAAAEQYLGEHSAASALAYFRIQDQKVADLTARNILVRRHEIHPNLWRPFKAGPTLLVGTPQQIATRLQELHGLGVGHINICAQPAVSDALRFGEEVLPLLQAKGLREEQRHHVHP
ncbi:LLM class flavin-dependent oxidoreductase [Pseudomonas syringae]|uniref:LLM class flavin-dependent oxidoreductase n=1 Tax=Pseudomonas syringae TaxID=317 RepID=UPI000BB5B9F7|nr:LLM class flavin-dependent oxidoreductase [Pseudomonas syringae]PBQ10125.1 LLM class flavin-dependent oxidoreductase [Pseudomonas syringae]